MVYPTAQPLNFDSHAGTMAVMKNFLEEFAAAPDDILAGSLVRHAGQMANRMRAEGLSTDYKTSITDVVTEADRAAEEFISTVLRELRPNDGLLGEEGATADSTSGRTWVIDPVDGTYNFTTGSDYWCSALALVSGPLETPSAVHLGAVYRPVTDTLWLGGADQRTVRNEVPTPSLIDVKAADGNCATYLNPNRFADAEIAQPWFAAIQEFATVRMLGSASLDLAGVADGRIHCWFQHSVASWDWLPGRALVEGAGGSFTKVDAGGTTWSIAGGPRAVESVVAALTA